MQNVKISIVTPCYNSEKTLRRTLDSVSDQDYRAFEYIVVDGGSTDSSVDIARSHPAVSRVISEPDDGISDAFNKGILAATGDVVGIINSDDWYESDALARCAKRMSDPSVDIVYGRLRYWDGSTPMETYIPNHTLLNKEMTVNHPTMFVRRSLYKNFGNFDTKYKYAMDYELALRFYSLGANFSFVDATMANMSIGGASDVYWKQAYIESARIKSKILQQPFSAWRYCMWQICRTATRKALVKFGLEHIVRLWRKKYSIMQKEI